MYVPDWENPDLAGPDQRSILRVSQITQCTLLTFSNSAKYTVMMIQMVTAALNGMDTKLYPLLNNLTYCSYTTYTMYTILNNCYKITRSLCYIKL